MKRDRLCTVDLKAVNHVLMHHMEYQKLDHSRRLLSRFIGEGMHVSDNLGLATTAHVIFLAGLLIVEGDYEQFYCVEHWLISDYTKAKPIAGRCALIAEHLVPRS